MGVLRGFKGVLREAYGCIKGVMGVLRGIYRCIRGFMVRLRGVLLVKTPRKTKYL